MKIIIAAAALSLLATAASATEFKFEVVGGAPQGAVFHNYQPYGNPAQTCPGGKVRLEPAKRDAGGKPMSREAIARGDKRWHVACVRDGAPTEEKPAAQQQRQIRQN